MGWLSIERVYLALNIMANAGNATRSLVMGRGRDFDHWFKVFPMAKPEHWKACLFFSGNFYVDYRAQMGRVQAPI